MEVKVMGVTINLRTAHAPTVQTVLTKYGDLIKTRLGLHETADDEASSEHGIILLHLRGDDNAVEALRRELMEIEGVRVNTMTI